jgi:acid phosphatase family membrane protein YuiD
MNPLQQLFTNPIFISAILGWAMAQIAKAIVYTIVHREFRLGRLLGSGGMPSSHSATVCGLLTAVGFEFGPAGFEFAISMILAIIVMNDAMGVRRETGKQSQLLNDMKEWFERMGANIPADVKLREFVGHTPMQVLVGAIIGILMGLLVYSTA